MKHVYKLIAHPHGGSTLEATAAELAAIMREHGIDEGQVIHNDRRYDVKLHPPYLITPLDGWPENSR